MNKYCVIIAFALLVTACGSASSGPEAAQQTTAPARSSAPDEFGNVGTEPEWRGKRFSSAIDVGETVPFEVWNWCYPVIELGNGDWYLHDTFDFLTGDGTHREDFPEDWDVWVFNAGGSDGPDWVVFGVDITRVDERTLAATEQQTGEHVTNFVLDTTPPEDRLFCG